MYIRQIVDTIGAYPRRGVGLPVCGPPLQIVIKKKKQKFYRQDDIEILRKLPFSRNRPRNLDDEWYIKVLINII